MSTNDQLSDNLEASVSKNGQSVVHEHLEADVVNTN